MNVIDRWWANMGAQVDQRDALERWLDNIAAQQMSAGRECDKQMGQMSPQDRAFRGAGGHLLPARKPR